MGDASGNKDGCSLEFWRQRLAVFRINPSRLSYANNGKVVASGGYGSVRKATLLPSIQTHRGGSHHEWHGRESITPETVVAVKSLQAHGDIDLERFEKRFIREAYIWSQLKHKNILEFLGFHFSSSDGEVEALLVCPWFDNGQSTRYLKRQSLSPMGRLQLVLDAAEGLDYLHSRDPPICHGDVKGSNLLIKNDGRGALCDFGSAHELDEMFQEIVSKSTQRCTIRWASPERLDSNDPPAPSSDVWSWGWLTWEIMTGKVPFHLLTNVHAVIYHIATSKLPSCEKEAGFADLPHLSLLVRRCWLSAPDSRPRIRDIITDLKRILEPNESQGEQMHASSASLTKPLLSNNPQRHHPFRLSQSNKSTLRGTTVNLYALSRPEETLGRSPPSERSITITNTSDSVRPTADANNRWSNYPPGPRNGSPVPVTGFNGPGLFPAAASLFLSSSKPLEVNSYIQSPESLKDAVYLADFNNKQSGTHVPVSDSLSNPIGEDQWSSLTLSGSGEAGSGTGRQAFAGAPRSSTLGSQNLNFTLQCFEASVIAPLPNWGRLSGEGVVEGESNEGLSDPRSAGRPTHLSARPPSFDPQNKAIYTEVPDYSRFQPPYLQAQEPPTSNSTISHLNLGSVNRSNPISGAADLRCGTSEDPQLPAPHFATPGYYVPSLPPATLPQAQAISAPYSPPTTLPYYYVPHDAPSSISFQPPRTYASYRLSRQASRAPSTTSINPPQPQAYHAPSPPSAAPGQYQPHGASSPPSITSLQPQVAPAAYSAPNTWSYHSAPYAASSSTPSQFSSYYASYSFPTMSLQSQASRTPSTASINPPRPQAYHAPSPPLAALGQYQPHGASSPPSITSLQSQVAPAADSPPFRCSNLPARHAAPSSIPSQFPSYYSSSSSPTKSLQSQASRTPSTASILSPRPQADHVPSPPPNTIIPFAAEIATSPPSATSLQSQANYAPALLPPSSLSGHALPNTLPRTASGFQVFFAPVPSPMSPSVQPHPRTPPPAGRRQQTYPIVGVKYKMAPVPKKPRRIGVEGSASTENLGIFIPLVSAVEIKLFRKSSEEDSNTTQKGIVKATGRLVAVKSLPSFAERALEDSTYSHSESREWLRRCLSLKHPRIAELFGCMLSDSGPTVITVWYPKGDIVNFLEVAPLAERKPMLRQIAEGLSFLHTQTPPIIHSNLKPSNILIGDEGNVKLTDVGILRFVEMNDVQDEVPGKPEDIRWTAPEILEGHRRDTSSDIYAFGCVAIMILKDRVPYASLQSNTAVARAVAEGVGPIDSLEAAELHEIWRNCLAREAFRRPTISQVEITVGTW